MTNKKQVLYVPSPDDYICEGVCALLANVVNHPSDLVSNQPGKLVRTSKVLRIHEGYFETMNTYYCPSKEGGSKQ